MTEGVPSDVTQAEGVVETTPVEAESVEVPTEPTVETGDLYDIEIGGERQQVTLEELRKGYMRQADYTRKTQEVAETRKQLSQAEALLTAFQSDPQGTLKAIADHYGMTVAEARQAVQDVQDDYGDLDPEDPVVQRLARIEQIEQERAAAEVRSQIDNEFSALEGQYGEFDRNEVIAHALRTGVTVTDAFKIVHFDRVSAQKAKAAEEAKVVEAKREAQVVSGGSHTQPSAVGEAPKQFNSVRDAALAAIASIRSGQTR